MPRLHMGCEVETTCVKNVCWHQEPDRKDAIRKCLFYCMFPFATFVGNRYAVRLSLIGVKVRIFFDKYSARLSET